MDSLNYIDGNEPSGLGHRDSEDFQEISDGLHVVDLASLLDLVGVQDE